MRKIKKYVDGIEAELCDAKNYAECYVENKASGNMSRANKYKEMANDELKHSMILHQISIEDITELNNVFTPTAEMEEKWEKAHKDYVDKSAWIKQMLSM